MRKKILCFALALLMVCGVFMTGCSSDKEDETVNAVADTEESSRSAMTVSLWLPTDSDTTEEAKALVSEAINKLTQAKYNTAVDLHLIDRDEYQETIDKQLEEVAEARIRKEEAEEEERLLQKQMKAQGIKQEVTASEVETDDEISAYPDVAEDQMDIFLVSGYDNYVRYIDEDLICQLDGELSSNSKILRSYIYPHFFDIADEFGIYGIPNNHPVGEYQYLLVNKELVEKYDYDPDTFTTLIRCKNFIIDMGNQNLEGCVPLLDEVDSSGMTYWGIDGEWSVLASQFGDDVAYNKEVDPVNVLTNAAYTNLYTMMKTLKGYGYVGDGTLDEGEYFAVGVISGDAALAKEYEDEYYVRIHQNPVCSEEDVFGAMFSVSTYTKNLSRSMEIVTYINTDTEIRTILQYGVKGVHWAYEEDDETTIKIISDDYKMNLLETGNVYMTYPGEGISMDYWELGKQQNLDSVSSPYIKFKGFVNDENRDALERIAELSKNVKEQLDNCSTDEFSALLKELKKQVAADPDVKAMLDTENENSIIKIYTEWFSDLYPF